MSWRIERKSIGRAGGPRQQTERQRKWDLHYGEGMWAVGYVVDGQVVLQDDAWETIYYPSYVQHFRSHPADLAELIALAKDLRNPHTEATGGVDLQVPAIRKYLSEHGLELQGNAMVDIGTWNGEASHTISVRLSPLQIKCAVDAQQTLEGFWQAEKCLLVWESEEEDTLEPVGGRSRNNRRSPKASKPKPRRRS